MPWWDITNPADYWHGLLDGGVLVLLAITAVTALQHAVRGVLR